MSRVSGGFGYQPGVNGASTAPTTHNNITAGGAGAQSWTTPITRLKVNNISAATLYVLIGSGTASATNFDFRVAQGDDRMEYVKCSAISIYCASAATYGTDFLLGGWYA